MEQGAIDFAAEIASRTAQEDHLAAYFEGRPFVTVTHDDLVAEVGENYRSRISPLRKKRGMNIENVPAFKADGKRTYGSYRYRPDTLGRDAADVLPGDPLQGTLFDTHVSGWQR